MKVILKKHPTIEGLYATRDGKFFQLLPMAVGYGGYVCVSLYGGGRVRRSALVLETWKGLRPKGKVARHMNGNPKDDEPKNLKWGTQKENCEDTVRHGRSTRGEKNARAKLTEKNVEEIVDRYAQGEKLKSIAIDFGIAVSTICDIMAGRTWGWLK